MKEVIFDLLTGLDSPKVRLVVANGNKPVVEKQLVMCFEGERAQAGWHWSVVLKGRYQYIPPIAANTNHITEVKGAPDSLRTTGCRLKVVSFSAGKKDLEAILNGIFVSIEGFRPHTCERVVETYSYDFSDSAADCSSYSAPAVIEKVANVPELRKTLAGQQAGVAVKRKIASALRTLNARNGS